MAEVLKRHPRRLVGGTFAVVACFAIFYLSTAFALGYGVAELHYSRTGFLAAELGAILFLAVGIVLAGWWSDRTNPRRVLLAGCVATVAVGLLMGPMMGAGSLVAVWAWLSAALFVMGFVYGPLGAFLPGLFPPRVRYSGVSIAFNVGGILGGGLAPIIAQTLADKGGLNPVGWYLAAAAAVSFAAIAPLRKTAEA
jgi:MFS family permease